MTSLPTITLRESYRRSDDHVISCIYRRSDDHVIYFFTDDPTITFRFFAESYRRSDDHISVFFPKITDDPTIKFRFFSRKLPTIRRSHFGFFSEKLPTIRRLNFGFFAEYYRRSDDRFWVFSRNYLTPANRHFYALKTRPSGLRRGTGGLREVENPKFTRN